MRTCRKVVLVLLCLCLTVGGRSFAMPMEAIVSSVGSADDMHAACPDMDDAMDEGAQPVRPSHPDCCTSDACQCAAAHAFVMATSPVVALQAPVVGTAVVLPQTAGYASPVLARISRPPIA